MKLRLEKQALTTNFNLHFKTTSWLKGQENNFKRQKMTVIVDTIPQDGHFFLQFQPRNHTFTPFLPSVCSNELNNFIRKHNAFVLFDSYFTAIVAS